MKWLRQVFLGSLLFVVGAVLLTAALRWFAVDDAAEADVALLLAPPPAPTGSNGFAALALIEHDVPVVELDAALAADVARFEAFERLNRDEMLAMARSAPHAAADAGLSYGLLEGSDYARRESIDLTEVACRMAPDDCLARVRDDADAVRELLARAGERTALAERALASGHLRSPYPASIAAPLPSFQSLRLPLTAAALDAVEGRVPEAMSRSCSLLAAARRHGADSVDLIGKMVMASLANGAAGLVLEIRRASPDVPLPPDCAEALAPVPAADYLVCEAMRSEFRMVSRLGHDLDATLADRWNPRDLFLRLTAFDADAQDAWMATRYADACRDGYREQVLAGVVPPSRGRELGLSNPTCWGAVVSCVLSGISMVDSGQYQQRLLDLAAQLRLQLAALAVLDGRVPREDAAAAAASPGYVVSGSADGRALSLELPRAARGQPTSFRVEL